MGLLPPVTKALDVGREPFGLAMALAQLMMGFGAPLSGGLIDRFGAGRTIIVCVVAAIAGLYFLYAAASTTDLMISGVLMGIGVSGTGVTSLVGTIGRLAPPDKRLSAIASIGMAAGIGGFVALPVMHLLIELVGWQQSLIWLMAITALLIPLAWPISGKPSPQGGPQRRRSRGPWRSLSSSKLLAVDGRFLRLRLPRRFHHGPLAGLHARPGPSQLGRPLCPGGDWHRQYCRNLPCRPIGSLHRETTGSGSHLLDAPSCSSVSSICP